MKTMLMCLVMLGVLVVGTMDASAFTSHSWRAWATTSGYVEGKLYRYVADPVQEGRRYGYVPDNTYPVQEGSYVVPDGKTYGYVPDGRLYGYVPEGSYVVPDGRPYGYASDAGPLRCTCERRRSNGLIPTLLYIPGMLINSILGGTASLLCGSPSCSPVLRSPGMEDGCYQSGMEDGRWRSGMAAGGCCK